MLGEAEYRGYKIVLEPDGAGWRVWLVNTALPIVGNSWFRTSPSTKTEDKALAEAKRVIDETLSG